MLYAVVFVTLFSIGWSLIYEFDVYKFYFDITRSASSSVPVAASCYNNRNTYATVLLLGICAISLIHSDNPRFWNYILLFGFYFELFFVISKTGILVSTFFLVLYVFYRFAVNVRYHRLRAGLGLTLFIASFTSIFIIGELQLLSRDTAFMKLYMNFVNAMNTQIGSEFLDYRTEIWINSFNYLFDTSPHMAIFGVGEINALKLLREMWQRYEVDFYYTHNGFVHQIFAGGFLRLGVYLIVLVYYCYIVICNAVKGRRTAVTYLFVALAFLGHGLTETTSLIGTDSSE